MPRLTDLKLSHFRSHRTAKLDLDGRPVAFLGPNGAGKTNLLEAVSLFSPGRGLRRASAAEMSRRPEALGWKLSGLLQVDAQIHEVETWSEDGGARQVRLDGKASTQIALGRLARVVWLVPAMDRLWIEGTEGRRRFLDRMTMSFEPDHAEASLHYERAMRERNRLLKDNVRDTAWYEVLEARMAQAGIVIDMNRRNALTRIAEAQQRAATAFPAAELQLVHNELPLPESEQSFRLALADNRSRDMAAGRTLIGPHRADMLGTYAAKGVAAKDCSTGEQKALLISVILANARALKRDLGSPPMVLLDEVAAHLDAQRRASLYDEIVALGCQAFMTGTEQSFFEALGERAQYFEVSDVAGTSAVASA